MKKAVGCGIIIAGMIVSSSALAADKTEPRHRWVGMQMDVGVPDGAALGLVLRPIPFHKYDWLHVGVSGTYNVLAPGIRVGATFDPIKFPVAPTLTAEYGHAFEGKVPGVDKSPGVSYDYTNLHLGLEFGNRDTFRFFLRGGVSYLNVNTSGFQETMSNKDVAIGNPSFTARVAPTAKLGFSLYF